MTDFLAAPVFVRLALDDEGRGVSRGPINLYRCTETRDGWHLGHDVKEGPTMTGQGKTIGVFADTVRTGQCSGRSCRATITWARVAVSNHWMCFSGAPVALRTESASERPDGRRVEHFAFDDNHWATCPNSADFGRARSAR